MLASRNYGNNWYIGAITNEKANSFEINFDFLDDGNYDMEYIEDGINANTRAIDYKKNTKEVSNSETIKINLSPSGGWVARITKIN